VLDVRFSGIQHRDFLGIGVEAGDLVSSFRETQRQRQTYVTATDDAYLELSTLKKLWLSIDGHEKKRTPLGLLTKSKSARM
jgi:hypothetical protein